MDLMYRTPSDNTICKCIITKDAKTEPENRKWFMENSLPYSKIPQEEIPVQKDRKAGDGLKKGSKKYETAKSAFFRQSLCAAQRSFRK